MGSRSRVGARTAESGAYPPVMPFPSTWMSGITPYGSIADQVPVRPAPVRTSSAMKSTLYLSQISRTRRKYPGEGTDAPVELPPTGSAMNAATIFRSGAKDRVLQHRPAAYRTSWNSSFRLRPQPSTLTPVAVRSRDPHHINQPLTVIGLVVLPSRRREREQGVSVVGRNRAMILCLDGFPVSTQYWRASFRAASTASSHWRGSRPFSGRLGERGEFPRELFYRLTGEGGAVQIGNLRGLLRHGRTDLPDPVTDVGDEGPTGPVEIALPVFVDQPAAISSGDEGETAG